MLWSILSNRFQRPVRQTTRRRPGPHRDAARLESLECRYLLSAIAWTGAGDAACWNDDANWDLGRLPAAGDDVSIPDVAATTQVLLAGTHSFNSLISNESLRIQGADITVPGSIQVNNSLLITSATVNDATILPGTGFPEIQVTTGTVLRNTTIDADVDIVFAGGIPTQIEDLTLNGTLTLNDGEGITLAGDQTLSGTGTIVMSSTSSNPSFGTAIIQNPGTTLTIGAGISIHATSGAATFNSPNGQATLVNEGTISANGGVLQFGFNHLPFVDVVNHGTVEASDGGLLTPWSQFTNTGTLQSVNTSQFSTVANLTSSGVIRSDNGLIQVTNLTTQPGIDLQTTGSGQIRLINVNNVGNTVMLNGPDNSIVFQGGTWEGGTIDGPASLHWGAGGLLKDAVLNADALTFSTGGAPRFENLTLNGTVTNPSGMASNVSQTLLGDGEIVFAPHLAHFPSSINVAPGTTLKIESGVTVRGNGTLNHGGEVINQGTMSADVTAAMLEVDGPYTLGSRGTLSVSIGGVGFANHGFLRARDDVTLNGRLNVSLANGFAPTAGQQFLIVDKVSSGSIAGAFSNLAEGEKFIADGFEFQISYTGFGNDVVLTSLGTVPTWNPQDQVFAVTPHTSERVGRSVTIDGDWMVVGAPGNSEGSAYVFRRDDAGTPNDGSDDRWLLSEQLKADDAASGDNFGESVSIHGDTIVVGSYRDDDAGVDSGSAYVFARSGTSWTQQAKLTAADAAAGDRFGRAVSVNGDSIVVGSYLDDDAGTDSGSAYVFTRSGTTWTQQAKLTADNAAAGDTFGWSVTIDGDTVVVGSRDGDGVDTDSGAAYVFTRTGTTWSQQARLIGADGRSNDSFGASVAIDGDNLVVGASQNRGVPGTPTGSAYVFSRTGTTWTQQAKLVGSDAAGNDFFGGTVGISGDRIVVGSTLHDGVATDSGAAYVFTRQGTGWTQQSKLTATDGAVGDSFGTVAISGDHIAIGSQRDTVSGLTHAGSVSVFLRTEPNAHAPVFTSSAAVSVAEGTTTVQTVSATDADLPAQTITYSVSGGADAAKFTITAGDQLQIVTAPDFEAPADANGDNVYEVELTADDGNGRTTTQTVLVTVTNIAPTTPVDTDSSVNTIPEAAASGTQVGITAASTDVLGPAVAYSLTNNAGGRFAIDSTTGIVTVADSSQLDGHSTHSITVQASDGAGGTSTASFDITVTNVAPIVTAATSSNPDPAHRSEDGTVSLSGAFTDVALDTHSVTVDWGDGATQTVDVDQLADTFAGTHDYSTGGIFTIMVTATDSDGTVSDAATTQAVVTGVGLVDGTLYIIGSDGDDSVKVKSKSKKDELQVKAKLNRRGSGGGDAGPRLQESFALSSIDRIVSYLGSGDDDYDGSKVNRHVELTQIVFGEAGNDEIKTGSGNDVLSGGIGRDKLKGGSGLDILIGGIGRDRLKGNGGADLLIGGSAENEEVLASVDAALADWASGDLASALDDLGSITDDLSRDILKGGKSKDALFGGVKDKLKV